MATIVSPTGALILSGGVLELARRFLGLTEVAGQVHNPQIMAMLKLDQAWPGGDEVAWCAAFVNYVAWLAGLERTAKLNARSFLTVGQVVDSADRQPGDVVILSRGAGPQPGPQVIDAPGHVGFLHGELEADKGRSRRVTLLGGNQGDAVSVASFAEDTVLGVRRLRPRE